MEKKSEMNYKQLCSPASYGKVILDQKVVKNWELEEQNLKVLRLVRNWPKIRRLLPKMGDFEPQLVDYNFILTPIPFI